jgi:HlyD family secretion protein
MPNDEPPRENLPDPEVERTLGVGRAKRGFRAWWIVLPLVLATVAAAGWYFFLRTGSKAAIAYDTTPVKRGELRVIVTATGTIQGLSSVEVGSEVSGKATKVYVDANDHVEVGQLLAEIDTEQLDASVEESRARVASADAQISQAKATLEETRLSLERAEGQAKQGLIAAAELEGARAAAARSRAQLASAIADATLSRASLRSTSSKRGKARIVSPVKGIVLKRSVEEGQTVTAGFSTPVLFKLTEDLTKMRLSVYVDEADVGRVRDGLEATFTVDAFPDRTFPSKVISVRFEPTTENNVVSYEAILQVDNGDLSLRPGMTASATIIAEKKTDVLLVPNVALRFAPAQPQGGRGRGASPMPGLMGPSPAASAAPKVQGPRVWMVGEKGNPAPRPVKIGATDGENTEITEGLEVGEPIITDVAEPPP